MKTLLLESHPASNNQAFYDNRERAFTRCLMDTYLSLTPKQQSCVSEQRSLKDILTLKGKNDEDTSILQFLWSSYRYPGIACLKGRIAFLNTRRYLYQYHLKEMLSINGDSEHERMRKIVTSNIKSFNLCVTDVLSNTEIFEKNRFPLSKSSAKELLSQEITHVDEFTLEAIMDNDTSPENKMSLICLQVARIICQSSNPFATTKPLPTAQKTLKKE